MTTTESAILVDRASSITERELHRLPASARVGSQAGHRAGPQGAAGRRAVELPGLRPAPDRRPHAPRALDGGRRRQPLRRLRHGLRRAVRRAHASRGRAARSRPSSTTARSTSRRASSTPTSPSCSSIDTACDVAVHELGHGGDDGRHPPRPRRDRAGQDRQGRGRLPRPPRRGDDLDEAAARPGRAGRRPRPGAADRRASRRARSAT